MLTLGILKCFYVTFDFRFYKIVIFYYDISFYEALLNNTSTLNKNFNIAKMPRPYALKISILQKCFVPTH